jgi:hypothetical protein
VTLFGTHSQRTTDVISRDFHIRYLQIREKFGRFTGAGRNLLPLTKRTFHDEDEVKKVSRIAPKVSDSENRFLVWLTRTSPNRVQSYPPNRILGWALQRAFKGLPLYTCSTLSYDGAILRNTRGASLTTLLSCWRAK